MTSILDRLKGIFQASREPRPSSTGLGPHLPPVVNVPARKHPASEPPDIKPKMARRKDAKRPAVQCPAIEPNEPAFKDAIDVKIIVDGKEAVDYMAEPQLDHTTGKEELTRYVGVTSGDQFSFRAKV
jgi:hypothetical protein